MGDIVVGVYYRPPDQEKEVNVALMIAGHGSHGGLQPP